MHSLVRYKRQLWGGIFCIGNNTYKSHFLNLKDQLFDIKCVTLENQK